MQVSQLAVDAAIAMALPGRDSLRLVTFLSSDSPGAWLLWTCVHVWVSFIMQLCFALLISTGTRTHMLQKSLRGMRPSIKYSKLGKSYTGSLQQNELAHGIEY
jgi:chromate transport protein ChrA